MFDDSNGPSGISFNKPRSIPMQQDDRTVNRAQGETRDRSRFQKLLKSERPDKNEEEEEDEVGLLKSEQDEAIDPVKQKGRGSRLDFSLEGEDTEKFLSLLAGLEGQEQAGAEASKPFMSKETKKEGEPSNAPKAGLAAEGKGKAKEGAVAEGASSGTKAYAAGSEGQNIAIGNAEASERGEDFGGSSGSGFGSGGFAQEDKDRIKQGLGANANVTAAVFVSDSKTGTVSGVANVGDGSGGSGGVKDAEASKRLEMWQMLEKMVDTITGMKSEGKVETTVTLNEPKLFQGAVIKIEEFDQAKGQFNIAFQNLSPDAKALLDAGQSKESLKRALEERGYMLHILTTSLDLDKLKSVGAQSQPFYEQEREGRGKQQGKQQQQQSDTDDDF